MNLEEITETAEAVGALSQKDFTSLVQEVWKNEDFPTFSRLLALRIYADKGCRSLLFKKIGYNNVLYPFLYGKRRNPDIPTLKRFLDTLGIKINFN